MLLPKPTSPKPKPAEPITETDEMPAISPGQDGQDD